MKDLFEGGRPCRNLFILLVGQSISGMRFLGRLGAGLQKSLNHVFPNMENIENMEMFSCSPTEMFSGSPTDIFSGSPTLFTLFIHSIYIPQ